MQTALSNLNYGNIYLLRLTNENGHVGFNPLYEDIGCRVLKVNGLIFVNYKDNDDLLINKLMNCVTIRSFIIRITCRPGSPE